MFKKKQLLPKDLAARAKKLDPAMVEDEVLKVLSGKPKPASQPWWPGQMLQAADWQAMLQQQARQEMERQARQARELERLYMAEQPQQQAYQGGQGSLGSLLGNW